MRMKKIDQQKFNIKLGAIIRKIREEKEMTRSTLAELSAVNEKYIGKIERGECSPSCFILKKLSIGLNTELTEFIKLL
jgi:transcriptional regulator with XRE-family HTH domain